MSLSLTTSDWITINQLIYKVNLEESLNVYPKKILNYLNILCPYSCGIFNVIKQSGDKQEIIAAAGVNISDKDLRILAEQELKTNSFIVGLCMEPGGHVSRGPIQDYMKPNTLKQIESSIFPVDMEKALCMVLSCHSTLLGYIILTRDRTMEAFCRRDSCALDTIRNHIALRLYQLLKNGINSDNYESGKLVLEKKLMKYALSKREIEVLYLLMNDCSDQEVCDQLFITSSTFKKHLNHIYTKLNVTRRVELMRLVDKKLSE